MRQQIKTPYAVNFMHRRFSLPLSWGSYSHKLTRKIESPRHIGSFTEEEAKARGMRLATGKQGKLQEGYLIHLFLLIDPLDGVIADAKFQLFGPSAFIGIADAACELLLRKNHRQALLITGDKIENHLRDQQETPSLPEEAFPLLNLVIDAIEESVNQCADIPITTPMPPPSLSHLSSPSGEGHPGWTTLSRGEKIALIEEIIAKEIRPYIELDAGGIEVIDFVGDHKLLIAYQGACTTCFSATGATLNAIQETLRNHLDPHILVIPEISTN